MGWFDLPSKWVFIHYENGKKENVANMDELTEARADKFKREWETARKTKVVLVTLENDNGNICKAFRY